MLRSAPPTSPPQGGAVDDGAASLLPHVLQFKLHAGPHPAQIDRVHPVEVLEGGIGRLGEGVLDAGIVECQIQTAECSDSCPDHRFDFARIRHVAANADGPVSGRHQFIGSSTCTVAVHIRQRHGCPRPGKGPCGCQANARRGAGDQRHLIPEGDFHDVIFCV